MRDLLTPLRVLLRCGAAVLCATAPGAQASSSWASPGIELGAHPVGLRIEQVGSEPESRLQLTFWFPAASAGAKRATYGDLEFFTVHPAEASPERARDTGWLAAQAARLPSSSPLFAGAAPELCERLLALETGSAWDAEPATGRHPVVLFPGDPAHLAHVAELLASHGMVVAGVALAGPRPRSEERLAFYERSADQLARLQERVAELPFADAKRVAYLGFGGGGVLALPAALRNPACRAFVTLDSALFWPSFASEMEAVGGFRWEAAEFPLLQVHPAATSERGDLERRSAYAGDRYEVVLDAELRLHHHDLTVLGPLATEVLGLRPELRAGVAAVTEATAAHVLAFLRAELLADEASRAFLLGSAKEPGAGYSLEYSAGY